MLPSLWTALLAWRQDLVPSVLPDAHIYFFNHALVIAVFPFYKKIRVYKVLMVLGRRPAMFAWHFNFFT